MKKIFLVFIFSSLVFYIFLPGCQIKYVVDIPKDEQDKLGEVYYKKGLDSFFISKSALEKIEPKNRTRKIHEKRLKGYEEFKIITEKYTKSKYMDIALVSIARIEEEYISDYKALMHYKQIEDNFQESKYYFEAYQKVRELRNKFIWEIEEYIYLKEYNKALVIINNVKNILPDFNEAYYYIGIIYEKWGLYQQAIREWKRLKNNPKAHFLLSIVYYDRKLYNIAIKELVQAIELDNSNPLYYYNLAIIYEDIGNKEKSNKTHELYLQFARKNENEKRWVEAVKSSKQ
ncbi:MAG: tetratricopeptide repeat protein [Candidatus Firestonebacteria bacterium]|nr:tetratricopeptide repeat protein [Candidatus Firestonebacteria bacterium]